MAGRRKQLQAVILVHRWLRSFLSASFRGATSLLLPSLSLKQASAPSVLALLPPLHPLSVPHLQIETTRNHRLLIGDFLMQVIYGSSRTTGILHIAMTTISLANQDHSMCDSDHVNPYTAPRLPAIPSIHASPGSPVFPLGMALSI